MYVIDEAHKPVCKIGQGAETCRYLAVGAEGMMCVKGTGMQPMIDDRVAAGTMGARGDNCSGWPDFKAGA